MKIALIGYGKMGRTIERIARGRGHEIVKIIDVDNRNEIDSPEFRSADVAIEFTAPSSAEANCRDALKQGVKVISGSTDSRQNSRHQGAVHSGSRRNILLELKLQSGRESLFSPQQLPGFDDGTSATIHSISDRNTPYP